MQSSIREMNGYFGTLIKTLSNKANVVNDLTLSQFLKHQSKRLNGWKLSEFLVTDSIHDNWTEAYSDTGSWADDADLLKEDDFKEPDMRDWWVKELNKLKNQSTKLSRQRQALKLMSYLDDFKNNSVEREIHTFLSTIIHAYDSYFFEDSYYGLENIKIPGYRGTWYEIDKKEVNGKTYYLLEHEYYGDETAHLFVEKVGSTFKVLDDESYDMSIDELIRDFALNSFNDSRKGRGERYTYKGYNIIDVDDEFVISNKNGTTISTHGRKIKSKLEAEDIIDDLIKNKKRFL